MTLNISQTTQDRDIIAVERHLELACDPMVQLVMTFSDSVTYISMSLYF